MCLPPGRPEHPSGTVPVPGWSLSIGSFLRPSTPGRTGARPAMCRPPGRTTLPPMETPTSWTPLFDGLAQTRAHDLVHGVAEAVAALPLEEISHAGLLQGHAGYAVFFHEVASIWPAFIEQRDACIERAVEAINAGSSRPTFQGGIGGIAWAVGHTGVADDDFAAPIDEALLDFVRNRGATLPLDLRSGLAGLGIYALERLPRPSGRLLLAEVIDRLAERAATFEGGVRWKTRPEHILHGRDDPGGPRAFPEGFYDLGMAHGIPALLPVLAAAQAWDVRREEAGRLLDGAFRYVLTQAATRGDGPRFGSYVHGAEPSWQGRFASCEGDPGVVLCLWMAATLSDNPAHRASAQKLVREVSEVGLHIDRLKNSDLCCGSAGVAHVFNRLWQQTREPLAREAALLWFERTFELWRPGQGVGGFTHPRVPRSSDLQYGAAGTALALLAAAGDAPPTWDRALLYSVNAPPPASSQD